MEHFQSEDESAFELVAEVERKDKERRRKAQPSYSQRVSAVLKKWRWREGAMSVGSFHVLLCFNLFTSSSLRFGHVLC